MLDPMDSSQCQCSEAFRALAILPFGPSWLWCGILSQQEITNIELELLLAVLAAFDPAVAWSYSHTLSYSWERASKRQLALRSIQSWGELASFI